MASGSTAAHHVLGQIAAEGDFLRWPIKDKRVITAEAKTAIGASLMDQTINHPDASSSREAPPEWVEVLSEKFEPGQPSYQWLPRFDGSHMQGSGAPKGTPFLGTVANVEYSVGQGWDVADMPGNTSDQKWFHFVYPHTPLRGFEKHPFFASKSIPPKAGGNP